MFQSTQLTAWSCRSGRFSLQMSFESCWSSPVTPGHWTTAGAGTQAPAFTQDAYSATVTSVTSRSNAPTRTECTGASSRSPPSDPIRNVADGMWAIRPTGLVWTAVTPAAEVGATGAVAASTSALDGAP